MMTADIFFTNRSEPLPTAAPEISYVVTLYQKLAFLPFLCAGLEGQRGGMRAEYIFIDDGSSDGTADALRDRVANWPDVLIIRQRNTGPAPALNRGLALARGRYIKPMDGDDILLPWASQHLLKAMADTKAGAALYDGEHQPTYLPSETRAEEIVSLPEPPEKSVEALALLPRSLRRAQASPSHWMFEAALLPRIGGSDPGVFIQDYSLELEIVLATKVAIRQEPMLMIPAAAPGRLSDNEAQTLHDINLALLRFLRRHPEISAKLRRYALQRAVQRAASWAFRRGNAHFLHPVSLLRIPAVLGLLTPNLALQEKVCAVFRTTHPIRQMPDGEKS
jgi:glycosyltransferase involved in cell wall biosynthesis